MCVCIKKNPIKRSILKCKLSEASTTMRTMWMPRQRQYFNLFFDTDAPSIPVNRRPSTMLPGNTKAIQLRTTQASLVIISVYHLSYMCYLWQGPSLAWYLSNISCLENWAPWDIFLQFKRLIMKTYTQLSIGNIIVWVLTLYMGYRKSNN